MRRSERSDDLRELPDVLDMDRRLEDSPPWKNLLNDENRSERVAPIDCCAVNGTAPQMESMTVVIAIQAMVG